MSLDSSGAQTNVEGGQCDNALKQVIGAEVELCAVPDEAQPWCYLFIHHAKVRTVVRILKKQFNVFVHKSIVYKRGESRVKRQEKATISGLVFVQGNSADVQKCLSDTFIGIYLVKNCSTKKVATIPDAVMQPFIQIASLSPTRIRFLLHDIEHYSEGNPLVRITSGVLTGLEGYRIRISRDKCIVTSLGGITIAIGGIHTESFENLDDYARMRREQLKEHRTSTDVTFTPLQQQIDACFFTPANQLDVMAITESLSQWVARMKKTMADHCYDEAIEIALFLLEEIGAHFRAIGKAAGTNNPKELLAICTEVDSALQVIDRSLYASSDQKDLVATERESLLFRYPFLPLEF